MDMAFDPFDVLGVPPAFDLDQPALQRAYLARTADLHPDLGADDADDIARLNHARTALADPERRANALLARLGGPSKEADRTLPPDFLMRMMEVQESIDAARQAGEPLDDWHAWADKERESIIAAVGGRFRALSDPPDPESLRDIRVHLNQWRYIERIIEQLDADEGKADDA